MPNASLGCASYPTGSRACATHPGRTVRPAQNASPPPRGLRGTLRPEHPDTLLSMGSLEFLHNLGTAQERYRVQLAKNGPGHIGTLLARRDLA